MGDYKRGMDLWMDLLTAYTRHSELQVITVLLFLSLPRRIQISTDRVAPVVFEITPRHGPWKEYRLQQ
jgi:hypothetical protein